MAEPVQAPDHDSNEPIPVPPGTLRLMLASARRGLTPKIGWSQDRGGMDSEAMDIRGEMLREIEAQLEELLES